MGTDFAAHRPLQMCNPGPQTMIRLLVHFLSDRQTADSPTPGLGWNEINVANAARGNAMPNRQTVSINCLLLVFLGFFLMAVTRVSYGQDTNASLSGTVVDPSSAAVPNAKLTLTNAA